MAFNIADAEQGRGLGSVLLEHIAAAARECGVRRFTAEVLPQNERMLGVFREAGYEVNQHIDDGFVTVAIDLDPTERSRQVMADREHRAEARSMHAVLNSRSVVVVAPGVGGHDFNQALAQRVLGAAVGHSRDVVVHAVGDVDPVPGAHAWGSLDHVPGPVDLAALALDPAAAIEAVPTLARLGVRGVLILSGGYAEKGPDGLARQRELLRAAHTHGMRVVGPASYGVITGRADRRLVVSLAARPPRPGTVGLFCQSASAATALLATAARRGLGLSTFVSAGNRADISGNDVLQFWYEDSDTEVACLYMESIGNPRKFSRIARRVATVKPVVVVFAGRAEPVVPPGHAVRPTLAPRRTLDDMLHRSGVVRAESTHHMLDIAQLVAHQPLPRGRRVAILATSAALIALVAEAATAAGLVVAVTAIVPEDGHGSELADGLEAVYAPGACDAVVAIDVPTVRDPSMAPALARAAARTRRPTVASVLGLRGMTPELSAPGPDGEPCTVPAYLTPEDAVAALGAVAGYAAWRERDHGVPVRPDGIDSVRARALVAELLAGREDEVVPARGLLADLLDCYGIHLWPSMVATTAEEAVAAADAMGWPVALKSTAPALRHRADLGAVRLDIADAHELRADVDGMRAALADLVPGSADAPMEVQPMAPPGVACVIRTAEDPLFGPIVTFGLAGDAADLLADVSSGMPPLTDTDVAAMVRTVRAAPRLFGYRGSPMADTLALEELIARVSVLADDLPEVHRLELYPILAAERGVTVLGARAVLALAATRADTLRRVLN